MVEYLRNKFESAGRFDKRGAFYSAVSAVGLSYALIWDRPIKWFAVIVWSLILCLGLYLILCKKDPQN